MWSSTLTRKKFWLVVGSLLVLGLLLSMPVHLIHWVGYTDLEVEFIVTDADQGQPIKGATIEVQSDGGFCAEREGEAFILITDENGSAKRLCKSCMCFGTAGLNIDTYAVHLPWWTYQVRADGYSPTGKIQLDSPEQREQVRRGKPAARLEVYAKLKKNGADRGEPRE